MHYFFNLIMLFWISRNQFTFGLIDTQSIYSDMVYLNNTCNRGKCSSHSGDSGSLFDCQCDASCVRFDTCCLDSQYIQAERPKIKPTCRQIHNSDIFSSYYLIVDRCPTSDSIWESQCREEISPGVDVDILKIMPVTSVSTYVTYKNYFCFRCHEINDQLFEWEIKVFHEGAMPGEEIKSDIEKGRYSLTRDGNQWMASFCNDSFRLPLRIIFGIPKAVQPLLKQCDPEYIKNCSPQWTDSEMSEKCQAYMDVRGSWQSQVSYKNIYCALCNFQEYGLITCRTFSYGDRHSISIGPKAPFSFTHLLDINNSDGDVVGKIQKCDDDHVWDRYAGICRKLTCALPGYKIKNGKCKRK